VTAYLLNQLTKLEKEHVFTEQPQALWELKALLEERGLMGLRKYGTSLMTWNGRDPYIDAMQELLDLWQYLTQGQLERAELVATRDRLNGELAKLTASAASSTPSSSAGSSADLNDALEQLRQEEHARTDADRRRMLAEERRHDTEVENERLRAELTETRTRATRAEQMNSALVQHIKKLEDKL
jgi:chromosome segregation ATPase